MKKFKLGLQLYSLRDEMAKDFEGTLKKVSEMGYEYVEFAGYYDKTAEEIKAIMDKYGLKSISVHQGYEVFLAEEAQEKIDFLKVLGVKYVVIPGMRVENHKGSDNYEKTIEELRSVSELLEKNGMQLGYHNHDFEFKKYDNKFLLEWLLEDLKGTMIPEIDTCWVHYAGINPQEYILKYKGSLPLLHLKDFACKNLGDGPVYDIINNGGNAKEAPSQEDNGFEFRPVGDGVQDIPAIIKSAEECGTEYLIVEHDGFTDIEPSECVKRSIDYLKSLGL